MSKLTQKSSKPKAILKKSNNNRFTLTRIREVLLHQQRKVESEIKDLEKDDPVLMNALAESSEPGTDSWMADVHTRAVAAKASLRHMLEGISKALQNLKTGKYGKCERCGKAIEKQRLEVMPAATLCITCSKKTSKK